MALQYSGTMNFYFQPESGTSKHRLQITGIDLDDPITGTTEIYNIDTNGNLTGKSSLFIENILKNNNISEMRTSYITTTGNEVIKKRTRNWYNSNTDYYDSIRLADIPENTRASVIEQQLESYQLQPYITASIRSSHAKLTQDINDTKFTGTLPSPLPSPFINRIDEIKYALDKFRINNSIPILTNNKLKSEEQNEDDNIIIITLLNANKEYYINGLLFLYHSIGSRLQVNNNFRSGTKDGAFSWNINQTHSSGGLNTMTKILSQYQPPPILDIITEQWLKRQADNNPFKRTYAGGVSRRKRRISSNRRKRISNRKNHR